MPKVIGSTSSGIKLTIPSRGEKNWDELIENSCFVPLSAHNHEGGGKGDKLNTDALNDEAVTEAKLDSATQTKLAQIATNTSNISTNAFEISSLADQHALTVSQVNDIALWNLDNLNDVSSTAPTSGQALAWNGSQWAPTTISGGSGSSTVYVIDSQTAASNYTSTPGDTLYITAYNVDFTVTNVDTSYLNIFISSSAGMPLFTYLNTCNVVCRSSLSFAEARSCQINVYGTIRLFQESDDYTGIIDNSTINCRGALQFYLDSAYASNISINSSYIGAGQVEFSSGTGSRTDNINVTNNSSIYVKRYNLASSTSPLRISGGAKIFVSEVINGGAEIFDQNAALMYDNALDYYGSLEFNETDFTSTVPIAARYELSTNQIGFGTATFANFDTTVKSVGNLTLSSGKAVIPISGFYNISAGMAITTIDNATDTARVNAVIRVNTDALAQEYCTQEGNTQAVITTISTMTYLERGDEVGLELTAINDDSSTMTLNGGSTTFLSINRVN